MSDYKTTVGLEIHAELATASKMFCACKNDPLEKHPNINICPVCLAHPGTLPVMNKLAVELVAKVGLALGGKVNAYAEFDRKNYFYPDLPKGYQISQYKDPIVSGGSITLSSGKVIRVTRVHLEEDAASSIHDTEGNTLIDYNRGGVPLMELVTEPDISSPAEARAFAEELQLILRAVEASHARLEQGEMRVEANISIAKPGEKLGTKVEVKNLNSLKIVENAIAYEVSRQAEILEGGERVVQETRGWDEKKQKTFSQRLKEEAHDYRYFPDPDLPPVRMNVAGGIFIDELQRSLPELPQARRRRLIEEYGFDEQGASILVKEKAMFYFFEAAYSELGGWLRATNAPTETAHEARRLLRNYLLTDLIGLIQEKTISWEKLMITPENFSELITMLAEKKISSRGGKDLLRIMVEEGGDPSQIVEERGLLQTSDDEVLKLAIDEVRKNYPDAVREFEGGNDKTLQYLIGMTMKTVKEKGASANPQKVKEMWIK